MSIGNLKTHGAKGSNYSFQLGVLRLLGRINTQLAAGQTIIVDGVNANGLLGVIPAGYMLEMIVAQPIGGIADISVDYGLTPGGTELLDGEIITPPNPTTTQFNHSANGNVEFNVYVTSADWGVGTVSFYLILRKIS